MEIGGSCGERLMIFIMIHVCMYACVGSGDKEEIIIM